MTQGDFRGILRSFQSISAAYGGFQGASRVCHGIFGRLLRYVSGHWRLSVGFRGGKKKIPLAFMKVLD